MLPTKEPVTTRTRSTSSCFMSCLHPQLYMHHPFAIFLVSGLFGFIVSTLYIQDDDDFKVYHASVNNDNNNNNNNNSSSNNNFETTDKMESNYGSEVDTSSSNGYVHYFQAFVSICVSYILISNLVILPIFTKIEQRRRQHCVSSTHSKQQKSHQEDSALNRTTENPNQLYPISKLSFMRSISLLTGLFIGADIGCFWEFFLYLYKNDNTSLQSYMSLIKSIAGVTLLTICKQVVLLNVFFLFCNWIYTRKFDFDSSEKNESNDDEDSSSTVDSLEEEEEDNLII